MEPSRLAPETLTVWEPTPRHSAFIQCPHDDVGYGGARGGGKSDAVLGDFVSYEEIFGQHAIALCLRRERTQLIELIERAKAFSTFLSGIWPIAPPPR